MAQTQRSAGGKLFDQFDGAGRSYCDEGVLVRETYKGDRALVCDVCETPASRLW